MVRNMNKIIEQRLLNAPIVPLIQSDDSELAIRTSQALIKGGLTVIEVVLRTKSALQCLASIGKACPEAIVGAGTVLTADQALSAVDAGAKFIVSPGLDEGIISVAKEHHVPVFPGVATASEAQRAWNLGLRTVKVFQAGIVGGAAMLKALASVFR